jgi:two-component system sensor histidine kinase RpfC
MMSILAETSKKWLLARLRSVEPLEQQQSYVRLFVSATLWTYLAWYRLFGHGQIALYTFLTILFGTIYSAATLVTPHFGIGKPTRRRLVCLVMDTAFVCYTMHLGGRSCAPMVLVLFLQTLGYPARYGKEFLPYSIIVTSISFLAVIHTTSYWQQNWEMAYALVAGLVVIPTFHVKNIVKKIQEAKEKAEIANRTKSRFLSSMSHELRTPLNGILGTVDLLSTTQIDPEQQEFLKTIKTSAMHLLSLVNDVLDISKIEEGKVSIATEDMDLHALVKNTASIVRQQILSKGLAFRVSVSPKVPFLLRGDVTRLRQILANLLSNAGKFTSTGEVTIRILKEEEDAHRVTVRFEVSDTGIGLTPDQQKRIFDRFTQADDSITRKYGGTGLGTTISKELVELMGGRIGVESHKDKGSTFWFAVPLEKRPESAIPVAMEKPFSRTRVLLVSADAKASETINGYLAALKVTHVKQAGNTGQAYDYARRATNDQSFHHIAIVVKEGLGEDPFRFATTLESMGIRKNMRLILVGKTAGEDASQHGYRSVVESADITRDFLNALHYVLPYEDPTDDKSLSPESSGRTLKVLVAEDNEINQMVIRRVLERAGHEVKIVANGRQALDALADGRFEVALLDLEMPVMSGIDAAREYLSKTKENPIPLVALTADATTESQKSCEEAGMKAYLTKPFEAKRVLAVLQSVTPSAAEGALPVSGLFTAREGSNSSAPRTMMLDEEKLHELEEMGPTKDFVKNLVWLFVRDSEKHIRAMEAALERRDVQSFCDSAHALKGIAGSMGTLKIMDLANEMQYMRANTPMSDRYAHLAHVKNEIHHVRKTLMKRYSVVDPATG